MSIAMTFQEKSDNELMAIYRESDAYKFWPDESGNILVQHFVYQIAG